MLKIIMPLITLAIVALGAAAITGIKVGTGQGSGVLHFKIALGAMLFSIMVHIVCMFHGIYTARVIRELSGDSEGRMGH
ncbi:MAG: hypothetical protein HZA19_05825 [Nitrospirae bacterium]|nr:hypothetical protein [Nitrospirota bacterium]